MGTGADARGPALLIFDRQPGAWRVRQILDDPAGDHDWGFEIEVDLDASDEAGAAVIAPATPAAWTGSAASVRLFTTKWRLQGFQENNPAWHLRSLVAAGDNCALADRRASHVGDATGGATGAG